MILVIRENLYFTIFYIVPPGPTSRRVLPRGEYDRRYRQAVCCAGCNFEPSDVAFCQITLAFVIISELFLMTIAITKELLAGENKYWA